MPIKFVMRALAAAALLINAGMAYADGSGDPKPVKNEDLWRALDQEMARHQLEWRWVAGHSGHAENERADELARAAIPNNSV